MIRLCVLGPSGRMGRMVIEVAGEHAGQVRVTGAVDHLQSSIVGRAVVPGVIASADFAEGFARADVYVDFTTPEASKLAAEAAREGGVAAVIGTTGLDADAHAAIEALAERVAVVASANFSLGVNVLFGLAERAARALGDDFDLEIVEIHHRHKRDAPSGTALTLADALSAGRAASDGASPPLRPRLSRAGDVGSRPDHEIGVLAVRGGDVAGEHTAHFLGPDERLELTHRAGSRRIFAVGAVRAALWVHGKAPGLYTMRDVLGL